MTAPVEIRIGVLTFIGVPTGVHIFVRVLGAGPDGQRPSLGTLAMRLDEWQSLIEHGDGKPNNEDQ